MEVTNKRTGEICILSFKPRVSLIFFNLVMGLDLFNLNSVSLCRVGKRETLVRSRGSSRMLVVRRSGTLPVVSVFFLFLFFLFLFKR